MTDWINGLRQGRDESAQQLWERYYTQLVRIAGARIPRNVRRDFDEEDIALSAFDSLCRGVRRDRFPKLDDRNNLWSLLLVITARKAMHRLRDARALKRGGGKVRGESAIVSSDSNPAGGINQIIGTEPTAEFAARVSDEAEELLDLLPDAEMRRLAILKMEGYSNKEIALKLECGLRTVERRLGLIRRFWSARDE